MAESSNGLKRVITGLAGIVIFLIAIRLGTSAIFIVTITIFAFSLFEIVSLLKSKEKVNIFSYLISFLFVGLIFSMNLTVTLPFGKILLIFTLVGTWVFDITAYYVGSKWGRHKIAPTIIPKKSYEGFIGGFLAVMIVGMLFPDFIIVGKSAIIFKTLWVTIIAVGAFAGDMAESYFKRKIDVKDSSKLIPGHGGFLDRFDSLMVSSSLSYILYLLIIQ